MNAFNLFGWFNLEFFAEPHNLQWISALTKAVGYNLWTERAFYLHAAAYRIINHFGGKIPEDPKVLLRFYQCGRKTMMIHMQDVHKKKDAGIVGDRHYCISVQNLGWTEIMGTERNRLAYVDKVAAEMEGWFTGERRYYVNLIFAGHPQMWKDGALGKSVADSRAAIERFARNRGCWDEMQMYLED